MKKEKESKKDTRSRPNPSVETATMRSFALEFDVSYSAT